MTPDYGVPGRAQDQEKYQAHYDVSGSVGQRAPSSELIHEPVLSGAFRPGGKRFMYSPRTRRSI